MSNQEMFQRSFKTVGFAMGVTDTMAFAAPALAQQDTAAMQRQLDTLRAQAERMEQQLEAQPSAAAESQDVAQTRELAEENRSLLDSVQNSQFTGTLQLKGVYNDWDEVDKDTGGDMNFGKFVLGVDGQHDNFLYSLEYCFYDGYQFLKKGWMGYQASDNDTVKVGLVQTPFGNMDYGYLGWHGTLPYLSGFNDNQNAGIKWDHTQGAWDTSLAFFKSAQLGDGNAHYGANPVGNTPTDEDGNPTNQGNTAAKGGQLYNNYTQDSGNSWQAAVGLNGSYVGIRSFKPQPTSTMQRIPTSTKAVSLMMSCRSAPSTLTT